MHYILLGLFCLFAVSVALPPECTQPKESMNGVSEFRLQRTKGTFSLTIKNERSPPLFTHSITLDIVKDNNTCDEDMNLIWYLERAVVLDNANFNNFTATYFGALGYYIEAINGVHSQWVPDKTYWQILNDKVPLTVGVSTYIPKASDNIVFQFFKSSGH